MIRLTIFLLFLIGAPVSAQQSVDRLVVFIEVREAGNVVSQGSGTILGVDDGMILTAKHVVLPDRTPDISVYLGGPGGIELSARVHLCDSAPESDFCLIRVQPDALALFALPAERVPVSCSWLSSPQEFTGYGFARGSAGLITIPGTITGGLLQEHLYPTNGALLPRMSGGPVVMNGHIVGIVAGGASLPIVQMGGAVEAVATTYTFVHPLVYANTLLSRIALDCPSSLPQTAASSLPAELDVCDQMYQRAAFLREEMVRRPQDSQEISPNDAVLFFAPHELQIVVQEIGRRC